MAVPAVRGRRRPGLPVTAVDDGPDTRVATDVLLVSHTHWDREWYRTYEAFRARLVDTVDRVLDQLDEDPGWSFLLDGQSIVVEDYLAVRPAVTRPPGGGRGGRTPGHRPVVRPTRLPAAVGREPRPQPARRAPGGRRCTVARPRSPTRRTRSATPPSSPSCSPDSGSARSSTGAATATSSTGWDRSTSGRRPTAARSSTTCWHAGTSTPPAFPPTPMTAAAALAEVVRDSAGVTAAPVVLMNGVDHMYPSPTPQPSSTGCAVLVDGDVRRGLLDDLRTTVDPAARGRFTGELLGGRLANLLPGVWSAQARTEAGRPSGRAGPDRMGGAVRRHRPGPSGWRTRPPRCDVARRALLANQAHDSIGGCSQDEVHRQMAGRTATATELADETTARVLERLAGLGPDRHVPWEHRGRSGRLEPVPAPTHRRGPGAPRRVPAVRDPVERRGCPPAVAGGRHGRGLRGRRTAGPADCAPRTRTGSG